VVGSRRLRLLLAAPLMLALAAACAPSAGPARGPGPAAPASASGATRSGPATDPPAGAPSAAPIPAADGPLSPAVAIKLAIFGTGSDAPLFVALEKGYFREEGLNVETIASDSAPRIIPFLASGQVDVSGLSQSPAMFNAAGRGVGIKVVANKGRHAPEANHSGIVVRKDLMDEGRVRDYADLRGLRISTPGQGTSLWGQLARALDAGGLTFADVELETLSQPDSIPALGNRALDAALLIEPFLTAAVSRGVAERWKSTLEFAPGAQGGLVAYAPHFVQGQPQAARRFMVAYVKAVRAFLDAFAMGTDKEAIVDILIKHTPVKDRQVYYTMMPSSFEPNGRVNVDYLRAEQALYAREGLLTDPVDVDTLVDHQYVEYAVARLGER
jgi:ABC-type nitrate/sulfonate/bicarbonate transport system substrate-binding protein